MENINKFSLCPKIGIDNVNKDFFKEYRIVALNINITDGSFCINNKEELIKDHTYETGNLTLTYWPNDPKIEEQKFIDKIDKYWIISGKKIEIFINYEVYPLYPLITIPSPCFYTKVDEFIKYYNTIPKTIVNNKYNEINDIYPNIRENITIEEFISFFSENNKLEWK